MIVALVKNFELLTRSRRELCAQRSDAATLWCGEETFSLYIHVQKASHAASWWRHQSAPCGGNVGRRERKAEESEEFPRESV